MARTTGRVLTCPMARTFPLVRATFMAQYRTWFPQLVWRALSAWCSRRFGPHTYPGALIPNGSLSSFGSRFGDGPRISFGAHIAIGAHQWLGAHVHDGPRLIGTP